jgi:hypothetical protein
MNWGATMEGSLRLSSLFTRSRKSRKILELDSVLEARSDSRGNSCRIRCSSIAGSSGSGATWAAAAGSREGPAAPAKSPPRQPCGSPGERYTPSRARSDLHPVDRTRAGCPRAPGYGAAGFPNGSLCVARSGSPPRDPEAWRLIPFSEPSTHRPRHRSRRYLDEPQIPLCAPMFAGGDRDTQRCDFSRSMTSF